ncbi:putative septation protein SpoVG [Novipirellula galeiformis]|uniref:Putative septation protein SpoVG n=1 Tax=Novipirellula galeiformis TaxID=2528004 RepID=A0A5C6CEY2_9BACT|nr:SpoVG family protein [Novipirellula galeiformis]TWU23170.1 putative septation protein SpoVG [Novipirellula galeiformis]
MQISEIRIKLMEASEDRLRAFCSITIDGSFVVRDLKIIDGSNGPFVAMPSRKLTGHCQRCSYKNHLRATYCNHCGVKLQIDSDVDSPQKLYADVAHPINSDCRELIQNAVIEEFEAELARASEPGYQSRYDDDFGDDDMGLPAPRRSESRQGSEAALPSTETVLFDDNESKTSGPKRPHFMDPQTREKATSEDDHDDGFGVGIF